MANPTISVIVSAYNLDKYLAECLDSLCAQTLQDFECIIVNDGSTDKTRTIAQRYVKQDKRFHLINKEHGGVSTARNAGFDALKGEYVVFLDGDDFFDPKLLDVLYKKIRKNKGDIAVCNYTSYYHSMKKYGPPRIDFRQLKHKVFTYQDEPDAIFDVCTLMFWNKIFRVEFLKQHAFRNDETLHRAQDIEFVGRALVAAANISYTDDSLVFYRTDTGASNVSRLHQHPYDVIRALEKLKKYLDKQHVYKVVKKSFAKIASDHVLANLYFTETYEIHRDIYAKAKQFMLDQKVIVKDSSYTSGEKAYKEIQMFLDGDYESWLRYRITDLRDDSEAKYISYLLGEFQRKYEEEVERYSVLKTQYDELLNSASWKVTKPLRSVNSYRSRLTKRQ